MLKYALGIGPLAICALVLAFAEGCVDEPTEQPGDQRLQEEAQACSTPAEPSEQPSGVAPEPTPHLQSPEEAANQDLELAAAARGWTLEEAEADRRAADAVGSVAGHIAANRPDIFIGSALSPEPGGTPRLYIKGPADQYVRALVATAGIEIQIVDNQPYSRSELDERQTQVVNALVAMGFENISAGADMQQQGEIEVDVTRQNGLPDDPDEILASLPADVREGVTLTLSDCPVAGYD